MKQEREVVPSPFDPSFENDSLQRQIFTYLHVAIHFCPQREIPRKIRRKLFLGDIDIAVCNRTVSEKSCRLLARRDYPLFPKIDTLARHTRYLSSRAKHH